MTNTRYGETANVLTSGSGSGSNRAENAKSIERTIPQLSEEDLGLGDVAIVICSLSGGSGSVISPLLIREYARRGVRVVGVAVADTSYSVGAKNTLNTLKTLTSVCKNNDLYLPLILVSNDHASTRKAVDECVVALVSDLIDLLTKPVYEVDRNDRLNWLNPSKVVSTSSGIKLMSLISEKKTIDAKIVLGTESEEMVDSLLILQSAPDEAVMAKAKLTPARLKKMGFYNEAYSQIVGKVTSDVTPIENIINQVERAQQADASQKHASVDRLSSDGDDDLVL